MGPARETDGELGGEPGGASVRRRRADGRDRDRRAGAALRALPALAAAAALLALPALTVAPNRLVPGVPVDAAAALGAGLPLLVALALASALLAEVGARAGGRPGPSGSVLAGCPPILALGLALILALGAASTLLLGLGAAAARLLADRPPAARASLGAGAWIAALALALVVAGSARALRRPRGSARAGPLPALLVAAIVAALVAGLALLALRLGLLDRLSLVVEYRARADTVHAALLRHVALAAGALGLALAVAVPLGLLGEGRPRLAGGVGLLLDGVQAVPALALFGLLVPALAALLRAWPALRDAGVAALGATPAVLAVAAYLLLPLVRGIGAALRAPEPAVVEAARAMGMGPAQIALRVRLPLGRPILVGGLRVAAVQAIGLAVLGGLVGAGGLGAIVFEGMTAFQPDLILLGALPVVGLSLLVDGALRPLSDAGPDAAAGAGAGAGARA